MFPKMRRFKQQLTIEECINILQNGKDGVLAVLGNDGYPYTVPLNYVYHNKKIYFHCARTGHKLSAIQNCNKVSFCVIDKNDIVPNELTTYYRSVIVFGKARILSEQSEIINSAQILGLKYYDNPDFVSHEIEKFLNALCCVEITPEYISGKQAKELMR
ncbi:MAG: pyridoxamine 5'-phosphate oxidase family protein [Clostridia bacterium]|nr:pyridoxamine 5'-phosphate oxidase family protein [Clostridia bacterium]